jgi:sec-independent protein translocase protein TatC
MQARDDQPDLFDREELPAPDAPDPGGQMGIFEHLTELRAVLIQSVVAALAAAILAWFFSERAVDVLIKPATEPAGSLVFLSPTGAFMLRLKVSLALGLFLAVPIIVWRLWTFVVPGLLQRERLVLVPVILSSIVLFYVGAAFAYLVILPVSIAFLLGFATESLRPSLTGEHYLAFVFRLTLAFGVVFQFPLVIALLSWWEIIGPDFLKKYWRYGVVLVFVLSAMLTPPDVASQVLMAGPVLALYFLSMGISQLIANSRRRKREGEKAEEREASEGGG